MLIEFTSFVFGTQYISPTTALRLSELTSIKIDSNIPVTFIAISSLSLNVCLSCMYIATPPLLEFILFRFITSNVELIGVVIR